MLAQHYSVTIDQLLTGQKTDYAARKKRGAERIMLAKEAAEKYDSAELRQFGFEKELGNMTAEDVLEELDQERKKRRKIMIELLNIKIRLGELIAELGENTQKGDTP